MSVFICTKVFMKMRYNSLCPARLIAGVQVCRESRAEVFRQGRYLNLLKPFNFNQAVPGFTNKTPTPCIGRVWFQLQLDMIHHHLYHIARLAVDMATKGCGLYVDVNTLLPDRDNSDFIMNRTMRGSTDRQQDILSLEARRECDVIIHSFDVHCSRPML